MAIGSPSTNGTMPSPKCCDAATATALAPDSLSFTSSSVAMRAGTYHLRVATCAYVDQVRLVEHSEKLIGEDGSRRYVDQLMFELSAE